MFWTHWNLPVLRSFYDLAASGSETEYTRIGPSLTSAHRQVRVEFATLE
jgi:hypothetical protein